MISFELGPLSVDRPIDAPWSLLIDVEADFTIRSDNAVVYSEQFVPVVELASHLVAWLRRASGDDFEWDSMSTPETGWVWIRAVPGGWRVGSIHQPDQTLDPISETELQKLILGFRNHVYEQCTDRLDISRDWLDEVMDA